LQGAGCNDIAYGFRSGSALGAMFADSGLPCIFSRPRIAALMAVAIQASLDFNIERRLPKVNKFIKFSLN
jgi:hypothetical protein